MDEAFTLADMTRAAAVPRTRIQELLRTAHIRGRRHKAGATACEYTTAEAVLVLVAQRLRQIGVSLADAAMAVRTISFEALRDIIVDDLQRWLVLTTAGAELADAERVLAIAESREDGLQSVRMVSVHQAIRDLLAMRLERLQRVKQPAEAKVIHFNAPGAPDGACLTADMQLAIIEGGKGLAVRLTPTEARSLAAQLLATADAVEAGPRPEDLN
jgi:hypothetical protein